MRLKGGLLSYLYDRWARYFLVLEGESLLVYSNRYTTNPLRSFPLKDIKSLSTEIGWATVGSQSNSAMKTSIDQTNRGQLRNQEIKYVGEDHINVILKLPLFNDKLIIRFLDSRTREKWIHELSRLIGDNERSTTNHSSRSGSAEPSSPLGAVPMPTQSPQPSLWRRMISGSDLSHYNNRNEDRNISSLTSGGSDSDEEREASTNRSRRGRGNILQLAPIAESNGSVRSWM